MKKAFFASCIAATILTLTPLTASALEVIIVNKLPELYGDAFVSVTTDKSLARYKAGKSKHASHVINKKIAPGKAVTILKDSGAKSIQALHVSPGAWEWTYNTRIKGSRVRLEIVKIKGREAAVIYSPQLKKYYYDTEQAYTY